MLELCLPVANAATRCYGSRSARSRAVQMLDRRTFRMMCGAGTIVSVVAGVLDVVFCFGWRSTGGCTDLFVPIFVVALALFGLSVLGLAASLFTRWPRRAEWAFILLPPAGLVLFIVLWDSSSLPGIPLPHDVEEAFLAIACIWPIVALGLVGIRVARSARVGRFLLHRTRLSRDTTEIRQSERALGAGVPCGRRSFWEWWD